MAMYKAKHYVTINGGMVEPGTLIGEELDAKKAAWLLSKQAIEPVSGFELVSAPEDTEDTEDSGQAEDTAAPDISEPEEPEEVIPDAPEIDVMDGIVAAEPPAKQKAARKNTKRGGSAK